MERVEISTKCTECANSVALSNNTNTIFVYKCTLSKKKENECLCKIKDYFQIYNKKG